jgi:hypothetical protein
MPKMPKIKDLQEGHTSPLVSDDAPGRTTFDELMDAARAMIGAPDPLRGDEFGRTAEATEALLVLAAQHQPKDA